MSGLLTELATKAAPHARNATHRLLSWEKDIAAQLFVRSICKYNPLTSPLSRQGALGARNHPKAVTCLGHLKWGDETVGLTRLCRDPGCRIPYYELGDHAVVVL